MQQDLLIRQRGDAFLQLSVIALANSQKSHPILVMSIPITYDDAFVVHRNREGCRISVGHDGAVIVNPFCVFGVSIALRITSNHQLKGVHVCFW